MNNLGALNNLQNYPALLLEYNRIENIGIRCEQSSQWLKKCNLVWDPLVYGNSRCTSLRVLRNYFATDFWQEKKKKKTGKTNLPCFKPPGTKQNAVFTWIPWGSWIGPLLPVALKWLWHFYQTGKKINKSSLSN